MTLALMQALLGFVSEARWLRHAREHFGGMFPYLPGQPGYNNRLRRLYPTMTWLMGTLVRPPMSVRMMCGWLIQPRSNAGTPARPRGIRSWPAGRSTGIAPRIRVGSGRLRQHLVCPLQGLPVAVDQGVDLGGQPAPGPAHGMVRGLSRQILVIRQVTMWGGGAGGAVHSGIHRHLTIDRALRLRMAQQGRQDRIPGAVTGVAPVTLPRGLRRT